VDGLIKTSSDTRFRERGIDRLPSLSAASKPRRNSLKEAGNKPAPKSERENERRDFGRNRLALQIRVRGTTQQGHGEEITYTQNASLSGLYFKTGENYREGSPLQVTYPYWTGQGSINKEYPARIVRRDRLPDRACGIAVEFLQSPRHKTA
jgi:hypothetical protein